MSIKLFHLGQWSYRNRWWVIAVWVVLLVVVLAQVGARGGPRITTAVTIDGTESEQVINELREEFPEMAGSQGTIVFKAKDGKRLDDDVTAAGLARIADDVDGLGVLAERTDLRDQLPGISQIPEGFDVDAVQGFISAIPPEIDMVRYQRFLAGLPPGSNLSELREQIRSLPDTVDAEVLRQTLVQIPDGADMVTLGATLAALPPEVDIAELQQHLANVPPQLPPGQMSQLLPGLPADIDPMALSMMLAQMPPEVDLIALQGIFAQLPEGSDIVSLKEVLVAVPADIDMAEMQHLMATMPEDIDLAELQEVAAELGADADVDGMREIVVALPPDMKLSELQDVMDVPLLTSNGSEVPGMLLSEDAQTVMYQIQLATQVEDMSDEALAQLIDVAQQGAKEMGIDAFVGESLKPQKAPLGGGEIFGLLVAALVLILTLGSLRAAGLPLLTALVGVGIGLGGALALSHSIELTSATPVLALMVGLAVGIDYALFIVNRARRLILHQNKSAYAATGQAVGTAGSAVVFAGVTVIIALAALTLIGITFLSTMALVAAVTVGLAVLVALTLLPALLGLLGEKLVSDRARAKVQASKNQTGFATKWVDEVIAKRGVVTVAVIAVLGVLAIPAVSMSFGMPSGETANTNSEERQAYDSIGESFGSGYNAPLITVIKPADGQKIDPIDMPLMAASLQDRPGVHAARPMGLSEEGTVAIISVIPEDGPNSEETQDLVHQLREGVASDLPIEDASLGVTGLTAVNLDISEKLAEVLPIYITIIVVFSLLILLVVFRSVLIPVKATLGFLLSIGATFGIITAVFQWGWAKELFGVDTTGPILSFLPIMVTGILYGLAMDYEMFLVTSMRQAHVQGYEGNAAIVEGFTRSSRVVVAAATIMVSVFAGFILSTDPMVKQFGTALSLGILIDAFAVRLMLVPAVMSFLGKAAWWLPRWLNRLLPNLDVEGHALDEYLKAHPDAKQVGGA